MSARYLGIVDPNHVANGTIPSATGDTFVAESLDLCGCAAFECAPGCRTDCGEWNNFRLIMTGTRSNCVAEAQQRVMPSTPTAIEKGTL